MRRHPRYEVPRRGDYSCPVADFDRDGVFHEPGKYTGSGKRTRAVVRANNYALVQSWTAVRNGRTLGFRCGVEIGKKYSLEELAALRNDHQRQIAVAQSGGWVKFEKHLTKIDCTASGSLYSKPSTGNFLFLAN